MNDEQNPTTPKLSPSIDPRAAVRDKKNPYRIPAREVLEDWGVDPSDEGALMEFLGGGSVPACCREGCEVEPDGVCPHGCPSVLLSCGLI